MKPETSEHPFGQNALHRVDAHLCQAVGQNRNQKRTAQDCEKANLTELEEFPVIVGDRKQAALISVTDMELAASYPTIKRKDGRVLANIRGQIDRQATTSTAISAFVLEEVAPDLERQNPGLVIAIGGATEEQRKSQASIASKLLLGLIGVYMVLAFQFRIII